MLGPRLILNLFYSAAVQNSLVFVPNAVKDSTALRAATNLPWQSAQLPRTFETPPKCGEATLPTACEWPVAPAWPSPDTANNNLVDTSQLYLLSYPEEDKDNQSAVGMLYASCFMRNIRKPLFTTEKLDKNDVFGPCRDTDCARDSTFHNDRRFCFAEQDLNEYYYDSKFDRGHLTPNAAFGTESQRLATFRLTNIVPQSSDRNRHAWEQLETYMRDFIDPGIKFERFNKKAQHQRRERRHDETKFSVGRNGDGDKMPTYDTLFVYTGAAYTLPGAAALTFVPEHAATKTMYFPIAMYKVAICVNATENSAIVMACWSDNPNGGWPDVDKCSPRRLRGPYGEHVAECPVEQAQRRCAPWSNIGQRLLSDECFTPLDNFKNWSIKDVVNSGLNWDSFIPKLKQTYGSVILDKTCFDR